jgi:dTDP-glucose 4,6-dehydratase
VGPYLPRDQHFAIGNFIRDGLLDKIIEVKAHHAVYRSYMHSDDLVRWLMTIASNATPNCPIWNVGSNEAILMGDLAKKIAGYFGVDALVPPFSDEKVDRYVPSIKKAFDE